MKTIALLIFVGVVASLTSYFYDRMNCGCSGAGYRLSDVWTNRVSGTPDIVPTGDSIMIPVNPK